MNLQTFDFNEAPVRVMLRDGQPWFVAADVCRVLEHSNARMLIAELEDDEKITVSNTDGNPRAGIPHQMNLISESGLYALVFKSRKAEAKKFRRWVTSEVLPAIRQTGRYAVPVDGEQNQNVSLITFLREVGAGWTLERQMEFGMTARRFAKAMGVVFEVIQEPGIGRVFAFPRAILEQVRRSSEGTRFLPDTDALEFCRMLEALGAPTSHAPDAVREMAHTLGLFPRIFAAGSSLESQRSAFGRLCERFNGRFFPGGFCLHVRGSSVRRRYEITQAASELALRS